MILIKTGSDLLYLLFLGGSNKYACSVFYELLINPSISILREIIHSFKGTIESKKPFLVKIENQDNS